MPGLQDLEIQGLGVQVRALARVAWIFSFFFSRRGTESSSGGLGVSKTAWTCGAFSGSLQRSTPVSLQVSASRALNLDKRAFGKEGLHVSDGAAWSLVYAEGLQVSPSACNNSRVFFGSPKP